MTLVCELCCESSATDDLQRHQGKRLTTTAPIIGGKTMPPEMAATRKEPPRLVWRPKPRRASVKMVAKQSFSSQSTGRCIFERAAKTYRLKAQDENDHCNRCSSRGGHGSHRENKAENQENSQHNARLEWLQHHQSTRDETHKSVEALCNGKQVR